MGCGPLKAVLRAPVLRPESDGPSDWPLVAWTPFLLQKLLNLKIEVTGTQKGGASQGEWGPYLLSRQSLRPPSCDQGATRTEPRCLIKQRRRPGAARSMGGRKRGAEACAWLSLPGPPGPSGGAQVAPQPAQSCTFPSGGPCMTRATGLGAKDSWRRNPEAQVPDMPLHPKKDLGVLAGQGGCCLSS